jgi:hypothetical protein
MHAKRPRVNICITEERGTLQHVKEEEESTSVERDRTVTHKKYVQQDTRKTREVGRQLK